MTDYYTPTTEQVRETYAALCKTDAAADEFDRWLAEHDFAVQAKTLRDAADAIERLARETTRARVAEHVLVDVGAPGVLREYARLFTEES